jgi:hypothetical protein
MPRLDKAISHPHHDRRSVEPMGSGRIDNTKAEGSEMAKASTFTSLVVLLTCAVMAGCSPQQSAAPPNPAPANNAVVAKAPNCSRVWPVQIDNFVKGSTPTTGTVTISHEPAHFSKDGGIKISWNLKGPANKDYVFNSDGVVFKASVPTGATTTSTAGTSQYDWCFEGSTPQDATWSYAINFTDPDKHVWKCDPTVVSSDSRTQPQPQPNPTNFPCTIN